MTEPDPRAVLASRLRDVADRLAGLPAEASPSLVEAERQAERIAGLLGAVPARSAFAVESDQRRAAGLDGFPRHPLGVGACAAFPAFTWDHDVQVASATITFGPAFEGPPGTVHGGFVAAAFDMVVSSTATRVLGQAVTRSLRIRYLRPTPLGEPLTFTAEVGEVDGRLAPVVARCRLAGGRLTAKAEGEFASVSRDRFGR
jgi:acyl-coenzyme A thioesterase PaaI-like protein